MSLSAEQKEAKKRAVRAREKAFKARMREYRDALVLCALRLESGEDMMRAQKAELALDYAAISGRLEVNTVRLQLREALDLDKDQSQVGVIAGTLAKLHQEHATTLGRLNEARISAWISYNKVRDLAESVAPADYSDIAQCIDAKMWKPLSDFTPGP